MLQLRDNAPGGELRSKKWLFRLVLRALLMEMTFHRMKAWHRGNILVGTGITLPQDPREAPALGGVLIWDVWGCSHEQGCQSGGPCELECLGKVIKVIKSNPQPRPTPLLTTNLCPQDLCPHPAHFLNPSRDGDTTTPF